MAEEIYEMTSAGIAALQEELEDRKVCTAVGDC